MSTARRMRRSLIPILLTLALAVGGVLVTSTPASAATITVITGADSFPVAVPGSLRHAIEISSPGDEIVFDPSVTQISLVREVSLSHGLTIAGPGSSELTILGSLTMLPRDINQDLVISGVTFEYNRTLDWALLISGMGWEVPRDVSLHDVVVEGYEGSSAFIWITTGSVLVTDSVFRNNAAGGTTGYNGGGSTRARSAAT